MAAQTNDDDACKRIWASVIIQALIDATSNPRNPSGKVAKDQAVAWLTTETGTTAQNFEEVCLHAEIDPARVRKFFRNYDGQPLTLHVLSRMRDSLSNGETDAHPVSATHHSRRRPQQPGQDLPLR